MALRIAVSLFTLLLTAAAVMAGVWWMYHGTVTMIREQAPVTTTTNP